LLLRPVSASVMASLCSFAHVHIMKSEISNVSTSKDSTVLRSTGAIGCQRLAVSCTCHLVVVRINLCNVYLLSEPILGHTALFGHTKPAHAHRWTKVDLGQQAPVKGWSRAFPSAFLGSAQFWQVL